ncbi:hypothetical protein [Streptococcus caballi]|uniref:hypothetical protein n=1 Tax=Streptococcus caballi TaxID=439220 RepID=UPI00039B9E95
MRAKYFYSTVVATIHFFLGGASRYHGSHRKLSSPEHGINKTGIVIGILIFGMLLESLSLRVAFKEIKELNTDELPL